MKNSVSSVPALLSIVLLCAMQLPRARAAETAAPVAATTTPAGLRVFTCGHSFHAAFVPSLLWDLATSAGIKGHTIAGVSYLGGSHASQHWDLPDAQNAAKKALTAGTVDVLTLSCMDHPDDGIANFAKLGFANNPNIRVTLQELWLPEDAWPFWPFDPAQKHVKYTSPLNFNATTVDQLKKAHAPYFQAMEDYASAVNKDLGKQVIFIVPDGQATMALRERIIAGTAPGLKTQSELFADAWGHPTAPLKLLSAYCHYAVIYQRSPVGLPVPARVGGEAAIGKDLNLLLQQLAWDAVTHHPMSGVVAPK